MDSHTWKVIYQAIRQAERSIPRFGRRPTFNDGLIVAIYVWSVWHDRPLCWGCDRQNYSSCFRPSKLPSVSQFCKRIKSDRCDAILQYVHQRCSEIESFTELSFMDGRVMRVGPCSKDRDAKRGQSPGGMTKGYKLHAWATEDGRIPIWSVMPLNVNEKTVAGEMLRHQRTSGIILADGNYDAGWLYDRVDDDGGQLITPLPKNVGQGHRRQSPARLRAAAIWPSLGSYVYRKRVGIERIFAHQSAFGGGLGPLPPWVRTLPRVRRWIGTKLIIYHARMQVRRAVI
jgi:hypothetical protein